MRIAVVGAGISGLCAAAGLQRSGHDVVVYERRTEPGAVGAGLTLFKNAFTALDSLGVGAAVRCVSSDAIASMRAGQRAPSGSWMLTVPPDAVASLRSIHRADLHPAPSRARTIALYSSSVCRTFSSSITLSAWPVADA